MLMAVDRGQVGSFIFALNPLAGAAMWLGARGEVGASDGIIAVAMSRMQWRFVVPGIFRRGRGSCGKVASLSGALVMDALVLGVYCLG